MRMLVHVSLFGLLACTCGFAGAQTIDTVAGSAPPATTAELHLPIGTAIDADGNLYVADVSNNRIRKVAPDGTVSTVAGTGTAGYSGDGGPATGAKLYDPYGVALDAAGNLYIADSGNHRVRKVDSSGNISTVVGTGTGGFNGDGSVFVTELDFPTAVVPVGTQGDMYIVDTDNQRIRQFTTPKQIGDIPYVATVAGGGADGTDSGIAATDAQLKNPYGLAVGSDGKLFIADTDHDIIRMVVNDGTIYTIAGSGAAGFMEGEDTHSQFHLPTAITIDSSGNLYVADEFNYRVRKITSVNISGVTHYFTSTYAGSGNQGDSGDGGAATSADLNNNLGGLAIDAVGNLYLADSSNQRVRRVGTDGVIATVIGNGTAGFAGDGVRASGFSGDNGPATAAKLNGPYATAIDAGGNIYIADRLNTRVRKITVDNIITTFAGTGAAGSAGDGGAALDASINAPLGVAVDNAGNVFIAENGGNRIRKVAPSGLISTVAGNGTAGFSGDNGPATSAEIYAPIGIAIDSNDVLYITDNGNARIRKVASGIITTVAGTGANGYNGDDIAATTAKLNDPYGVAVDAAGNIYIADTDNARIRKVGVNGIITTVAGNGTSGYSGDGSAATSAEIHDPDGLAIDGAGNVFFADVYNFRVRMFTSAGKITTVAGDGNVGFLGDGGAATSAEFDEPVGVAIDGAGGVYIADYYNSRIRKISGLASDRIFANGFE